MNYREFVQTMNGLRPTKQEMAIEDGWYLSADWSSRLVAPDGHIYELSDLIVSGSYFTCLIDSVVNLLRQRYLQLRILGQPVPTRVLGDGSMSRWPKEVTCSELKAICKYFAGVLREDKMILTRDWDKVELLSHYVKGTAVYRSIETVTRLACLPEQPSAHLWTAVKRFGACT